MRIPGWLLPIWRDPVGSNLIAALVLAGSGALYVIAVTRLLPGSPLASTLAKVLVPSALLGVALFLLHRYRSSTKTLVFLSAGGTCRDPMAKAIMTQILSGRRPYPPIRVRAAGLGPISRTQASYAARYVIREMYGQDLLEDHRPELLSSGLIEEADLILAMDRSLLTTPGKVLPAGKTVLLKTFLGEEGDVVDPWPDGKDPATLERYRHCAEELRSLLTGGTERILKALQS